MPKKLDSSPERRAPLTTERVLHAAVELADEAGIEAVTMRRLAQRLGVEAMSLYHHVANKDEILNGIVEIAVEQFELPADSADWKSSIRRSAISAHETFRRHRWACRLILTTEPTSSRPARFRYMNALLGCLRDAGFSPGLTYHGYHAIYSHTMGFTLWEGTFPKDIDLAELARTFLRDFPLDDYPHLAEHVEQHLAGSSPDDVGEFEFVLDLILDGLERARDAQAAT